MVMGVIGWIVLGLTVGYIFNTFTKKRGEGLQFDILLSIFGAVMGGWIFNAAAASAAAEFNQWSLLVALAGAVVFLAIWHAIRRSASHART